MLLCYILCFIGNIVIIISYHGWPARWVRPIPVWQPACLYICVHMCVFLMANKLCCCYAYYTPILVCEGTYRTGMAFLFAFHSNYGSCDSVEIKQDIGRTSRFFHIPLYSVPSLGGPVGILPYRLCMEN